MPRGRLLAGTLIVAGLAFASLPAAPAGAVTQVELQRAQDKIDATSAQLAKARTDADALGYDERGELQRLERRLRLQKDDLVRLQNGLEARHAEEASDAQEAGTPAPPDASEEDSGPVVRLADPPADATTTTDATVLTVSGSPHADERSPAVTGDSATLARQIDGYLASKASPLTGLGAVFVTEGEAVGLDPRLLVAIAGSETSFGTYGPSQTIHNPFGMGPHIEYATWSDAIRAAAQNLGGRLYLGSGLVTISAIQGRWAPHGATNDPTNLNVNWTRNVGIYYAELGGDPAGAVFTAGAVAVAPPTPAPAAGAVVPAAAAVPVRTPTPVLGQSGRGAEAAQAALEQLGAESVARGSEPATGFDASGLVRWAYGEQQVTLPRAADAQSRVGAAATATALEPGDAIFFSGPDGTVVHEGLYVGGGQFVHAPQEGGVVTTSSLYEPQYAQAYAGARRY